MTKQELLDKKGNLVTQADEILKRAKEDGRYDLTADENQRFDAIHADVDKITAFIEKMDKQESFAEGTGRRTEERQPERRTTDSNRINKPSNADRSEALRGWLMAGSDEGPTAEQRAAAQRCGINPEQKQLTIRLADSETVRALRDEGIAGWERRTAQGTTSGAVGAYTVPDEMMRALEVSLLAFGGMRSVATIIRTASGAALPIPTVNDTATTGRLLAENVEATETGFTFAQIVLESYKYSSDYVLVSQELLQDSAINVPEFIGRALGERIARITNSHFTTGDGSSKPRGIVAAAGDSTVTAASSTLFTHDELLDLVHSVDPAYRNNARFMFNDTTLKNIKKIKVLQYSGDTVGMPLWQPGLTAGAPDTILGYSYVINQQMASPASAAKSVVFGDLSKYLIRDVRDVQLLRLDERFATLHQVAFLAFSRHDGDLLDAGTDPVKWADHT